MDHLPPIAPSFYADLALDPVMALPYRPKAAPLPTKVLVPGKPRNRAYRRAEATANKKEAAALAKKLTRAAPTLLQSTTAEGTTDRVRGMAHAGAQFDEFQEM